MRQLRFVAVVLIAAFGVGSVSAQQSPPPSEPRRTGAPVAGAAGKAGTGFTEFRLGYYHNDDRGDGNPFLDEELTVVEPVVIFDYNVTDDWAVWSKFSYDRVSSASIDRLSRFPQHSGASGDEYFGLDLGARHQLSETTQVGGYVSGSLEFDYRSIGFGGHVAMDSEDHNSTWKATANAFFDELDVVRFDAVDAGIANRTTVSSTFTWYQVMSPVMHGELGVALTYQSGFLETPYNAVVVENPSDPPNPNLVNNARGTEITEELPGDRLRTAFHGRLRRSLSDHSAVELAGRIYGDTWGVSAFTVEPSWHQWLSRDSVRARIGYRYFTQNAADDYRESFTTTERYRTQDADLGDFDSHTFGMRLFWHLDGLVLDLGGDYQVRSDGLDLVFGSVGVRWDF